jgi:anti-sigma factor RsiW
MECSRIREQLSSYIDAALDERDTSVVAEHLANCAACRAELAALTALVEAARDIEEVDCPAGLRAAIAAATTQRHKVSALHRLRTAFAPNALRWALGFAGAAAVLVAVVISSRPPQVPTPAAVRAKSPASTHAQVAPSHPAPVTAAVTPAPPGSARETASAAPKRRSRTVRARTVAQHGLPPIPKVKPGPEPAIAQDRPATGESDAEVYGVDDTTVARTVTTTDIREPERVVVKEVPEPETVSVKVASTPLPKEEEIAQWAKDAKTAASMHRRGNPVGLSLINARF